MRISETFYSVQGEGSLLGMPSFFIRTSGCNLRCHWCDTPYASWHPEGADRSVDELLAELKTHPRCQHVVVTGGEPMIARDIEQLLSALTTGGWHTTVETAGTIAPPRCRVDLASVSPKLRHSTPSESVAGPWSQRHEQTRFQPRVIDAWLQHAQDWQLKFVVRGVQVEEDLAEISEMLSQLQSPLPPEKIILMPEGVSAVELAQTARSLVESCLSRGWRLSPRFHVDLWGHRRGV